MLEFAGREQHCFVWIFHGERQQSTAFQIPAPGAWCPPFETVPLLSSYQQVVNTMWSRHHKPLSTEYSAEKYCEIAKLYSETAKQIHVLAAIINTFDTIQSSLTQDVLAATPGMFMKIFNDQHSEWSTNPIFGLRWARKDHVSRCQTRRFRASSGYVRAQYSMSLASPIFIRCRKNMLKTSSKCPE